MFSRTKRQFEPSAPAMKIQNLISVTNASASDKSCLVGGSLITFGMIVSVRGPGGNSQQTIWGMTRNRTGRYAGTYISYDDAGPRRASSTDLGLLS